MSAPLKIVVIGPSQGGKTLFSNHVARQALSEEVDHKYEPTVGVRILKFVHDTEATTEIELWDCSGDQEYEDCWPAILKDLNGVIAIFDGNSQEQYNSAKIWAEWFATNSGLRNGQVILFGITSDESKRWAPLSFTAGETTVNAPTLRITTDISTDASGNEISSARTSFSGFIRTIQRALIDRGY